MARSIWTGAISFGLVSVPVKLYSAVNRKTVRFHQLNKTTGVRISQKRVDSSTGDEVPYEDIVKGYELSPDRYVVIEPEELDTLDPVRTRTIDIEDFVELDQIDPIFYDHPYYLAPGPGGAKPYRLLLEAMRDTGRVGDRARRHPLQGAARRDSPDGRRARDGDDAVRRRGRRRPTRSTSCPTATRSRRPSASSTSPSSSSIRWPTTSSPTKYRDSYRDEVLALIERKAAGEQIAVQPAPEESGAPVPDLMSALKASLDAVKARDAEANGAPKKRAPRAKPKASPAAAKAKPKPRSKSKA